MSNKRVFCIVIDSLGVGQLEDANLYGDDKVNTLGNIAKVCGHLKLETLTKLGLMNLHNVVDNKNCDNPNGYYLKAKEFSKGKDTITGHYELMGLYTNEPFQTYTETGFPPELIHLIEQQANIKFIGNIAASGTEIIEQLGEQHIQTKELILYTSADSVLQIAAHEVYFGLEHLYEVCEIARKICSNAPYKIGRIIARPFIGKDSKTFVRTSNRKDYALDPFDKTILNLLQENNIKTTGVGKIGDIFNLNGLDASLHSNSSKHGMQQTIQLANDKTFDGLCFTNLVDFDSLWGHRRNPKGYMEQLQLFDTQLQQLIEVMKNDDLLVLCADHGNDPTYIGSDHTREYIPVIFYCKEYQGSGLLPISKDFCVVGYTIADYFNCRLNKENNSYLKYLK